MNSKKLQDAFSDCKRSETSNCTVRSSYETKRSKKFFIFDEKGNQPIRVLEHKGQSQLTIINKGELEICIVKTDKCLFTDAHKKCDCILFSSNNIYLVEIKSGKKKGHARQSAREQLGDTIKLLQKHELFSTSHSVTAIICFKGGKTKPTQASANTSRDAFLNEYKIPLDETSEIEF